MLLSFVLSVFTIVGATSLKEVLNESACALNTSQLSSETELRCGPILETYPRLVMYVQTFTTPDAQRLSLLPLLDFDTKVTHIILASVHLHQIPGVIRLNNDPFEAPAWDKTWEDVKILQERGVKVMILLGGAAAGTYMRLDGTDEQV